VENTTHKSEITTSNYPINDPNIGEAERSSRYQTAALFYLQCRNKTTLARDYKYFLLTSDQSDCVQFVAISLDVRALPVDVSDKLLTVCLVIDHNSVPGTAYDFDKDKRTAARI